MISNIALWEHFNNNNSISGLKALNIPPVSIKHNNIT